MSGPISDPAERVQRVRAALPEGGLFAGKDWRWSPDAFPLSRAEVRHLERLGHWLTLFLKTCDLFYRRSAKGTLPEWIAALCDAGKPPWLVECARRLNGDGPQALPRVIRPDLILEENGFALSEIDSVPGGIGLLAWLNSTYSELGEKVIGGPTGMLDGFASLADGGPLDILVSQEAGDYRPEMEWIAARLCERGHTATVADAEGYRPGNAAIYRFFELFDWENIPGFQDLAKAAAAGRTRITAPMKPWLEEKLWLALLWSAPLRKHWELALRRARFEGLQRMVPFGWVVDPAPIPPHGVLPRLEVNRWEDVAEFSQSQRELVLKASGFHPLAWGARSVTVGHDVPHDEWADALRHACLSFPAHPFVMQEFRHARVVRHRYLDDHGHIAEMEGKVRLTPYYFIDSSGKASLGGVHATICPADKKILHGMSDALMLPCVVAED